MFKGLYTFSGKFADYLNNDLNISISSVTAALLPDAKGARPLDALETVTRKHPPFTTCIAETDSEKKVKYFNGRGHVLEAGLMHHSRY